MEATKNCKAPVRFEMEKVNSISVLHQRNCANAERNPNEQKLTITTIDVPVQ